MEVDSESSLSEGKLQYPNTKDGRQSSLLSCSNSKLQDCDYRQAKQGDVRNQAKDEGNGNMLHSCGVTLTGPSGVWRICLESLIVTVPVPPNGPALEDIESGCTDGPQKDVDQICPPSDAQPLLMDKEESTVQEEKRQLDGGKRWALHDHDDPDMLGLLLARLRFHV